MNKIGRKISFLSSLAAAFLFAASFSYSANNLQVAKSAVPNGQQSGLVLGIPFSATCGAGFNKAGQQKMGNGDMDWYVCSTPVLTCPSYTQKNGLKAHVTPKAIVKMIGASPDGGGPQKFKVQYKCDYSYNPLPEG